MFQALGGDVDGAAEHGNVALNVAKSVEKTVAVFSLEMSREQLALRLLAGIRHDEPGLMPYLRPDAKSQFTIEYDSVTNRPVRVHTMVLSTQHDEFDTDEAMHSRIESDIRNILIPRIKAAVPKPRLIQEQI